MNNNQQDISDAIAPLNPLDNGIPNLLDNGEPGLQDTERHQPAGVAAQLARRIVNAKNSSKK